MLILLATLIFSCPAFADTWYQETANATSANCVAGCDGSWTTIQLGFTAVENYSVPANADHNLTFWRLKGSSSEANYTIPEPCWEFDGGNTIKFSIDAGGLTSEYCYNSTNSPILLGHVSVNGMREDGMYWGIVPPCEYNTVQCFGNNVGVCDGSGWINGTCQFGCNPSALRCYGGLEITMSSSGEGIGRFLSELTLPFGNFILLVGAITAVLMAVYAVAYIIKGAIDGAQRR